MRNWLQNLHPAWIAFLIAVAVALWLASGMLDDPTTNKTQDQQSKQQDEQNELVEVEVRVSHSKPIMRTATVAGRTAPVRSVTLQARMAGKVTAVLAERGEYVEAGEVIVRLAKEDLKARLDKAKAILKQRRLQYQAAKQMAAKGYQTAVGVAKAKANLKAARARVAAIKTKLDHTVIRAPFSGVLETLPVEEGDYVGVGEVIGKVIQQDPFIVWGNVSEDVVAYLEEGQKGTATLITGETRTGTVRFISSVADPDTRTYRVELLIDNPDGKLIAGSSAELRLPLERVHAHKVEPSILTLNEEGVFGIKTVTEDGIVRFHDAQIVRNKNGYVWLTGLPDTLRIITLGQGFVQPGDKVDAVPASETPLGNQTTGNESASAS